MANVVIKKLQVLHDRSGRILAAVHDASAPGAPVIGLVARPGQTLVAVEVPTAHQELPMGHLFSRLQMRSGRVVVNDKPAGKARAKSRGKPKSRGRKT
jgi:hypothetical protein